MVKVCRCNIRPVLVPGVRYEITGIEHKVRIRQIDLVSFRQVVNRLQLMSQPY
ncbi:MAG: hypothetical protein M2R45_00337 [Verrucomicrobia subdivision 3 bacterium]|nr:hypothetical protein [Limisphaerales bacterium]MCS1412905.1 hypothetical protein [Limisphaerales bacterium]